MPVAAAADVLRLDSGPRPQIVEKRPMNEVHRTCGGRAQDPAPVQQEPEDPWGVLGIRHLRHGRQKSGDQPDHVPLLRLRDLVADHPVGDLLKDFLLCFFGERQTLRRPDRPFVVAPDQQHRQRRAVQLHPAVRKEAPPVAVQGTDHRAHEGVGGEPREVLFSGQRGHQLCFVEIEFGPLGGTRGDRTRRVVPAPYEGGDVPLVHRQQGTRRSPCGSATRRPPPSAGWSPPRP
ncbi:hypothetical protein SSPS47_30940 [Streptomyces sp. S4.7]|nr:hypothetical protein SSPS47_30940 [Streptomyces sp. S4.7]